jgi:hypothetical protein
VRVVQTEWGDPRVQESLATSIRRGAEQLNGLSSEATDDLVSRASGRIVATVMAMDPSGLERCRENDGAIDLTMTRSENLSAGLLPFVGWAELWDGSRAAISQIVVRTLPSMNEEDLLPYQSTIIGRSPLNARYPQASDNAVIVEVAIPLSISRMKNVGGSEVIYWGISYWYDEHAARWYPVDAITYAGDDSRAIFPAPM